MKNYKNYKKYKKYKRRKYSCIDYIYTLCERYTLCKRNVSDLSSFTPR